MRPVGHSFVLLVAVGLGAEVAGAYLAWLGLHTMAGCYWSWFPGAGLPSAACTRPIVGFGFHLFVPEALLGALVVASLVLGMGSIARLLRGARRVRSGVGAEISLPTRVSEATGTAKARRVELREAAEPYAACAGMLRPVVIVSTGLVSLLGHDELVAVLAHEERHRRRLAPLRQVFARSTTKALFFLPVLLDLLEAHLVDEEVLADQEATCIAGRHALVTALARLSNVNVLTPPAAAITGTVALAERLDALYRGTVERQQVPRVHLVVSALCLACLAVLVVWMPAIGLP